MSVQRVPMTKVGVYSLQKELDNLKKIARPGIVNAIAEARALGDLKENAEYHAAREQQAFCEGRIKEIENKLSNAQIIDVSHIKNEGKVIFGSTITLINTQNKESSQYQIVGDDEADIKAGKISVSSPMARSLVGKFEGDSVEVKTPRGYVHYEIDEVKYL